MVPEGLLDIADWVDRSLEPREFEILTNGRGNDDERRNTRRLPSKPGLLHNLHAPYDHEATRTARPVRQENDDEQPELDDHSKTYGQLPHCAANPGDLRYI